jgi:transcriptional regulator with PAS, ATPase and Fis domain
MYETRPIAGAIPDAVADEGTRVTRAIATRESRSAVLIAAGSANEARTLSGPRILAIDEVLELGRVQLEAGALPLHDIEVSRRHARIVKESGGGYKLHDHGSTNGTFVDGVRVKDPVLLRPGAVISIGPYVFVFRQLTRAQAGALTMDLDTPFGPVATVSPQNALVVSRLRLLSRAGVDLLLTGETGVGKEVYAGAIHRVSERKGQFIAINCAALPENLIESELFGYVKGAHSTAMDSKLGLMELADGGTLFLDEIGDMPAQAQAKLLRFLQDRRFVPLGSTRARTVDVRIVAATRRAVAKVEEEDTSLRFDLAMRLGPEPLCVPSLKTRVEDVGGLAWHFLRDRGKRFSWEAFTALFLHDWPGNVRELEKVVQLAAVLSEHDEVIRLDHLSEVIASRWLQRRHGLAAVGVPAAATGSGPVAPAPGSDHASPTREELVGLLHQCRGDVAMVARKLRRQRTLVWRWLRKHGCDPARYRPQA